MFSCLTTTGCCYGTGTFFGVNIKGCFTPVGWTTSDFCSAAKANKITGVYGVDSCFCNNNTFWILFLGAIFVVIVLTFLTVSCCYRKFCRGRGRSGLLR